MRRLLAILLLVFLPLQFSWAAVATYCEHEPAGETQHPGHHEHDRHVVATGAADGPSDPSAPAAADLDCTHCHGHFAALPIPLHAAPNAPRAGHAPSLSDARRLPFAAAPPERPQWLALA